MSLLLFWCREFRALILIEKNNKTFKKPGTGCSIASCSSNSDFRKEK